MEAEEPEDTKRIPIFLIYHLFTTMTETASVDTHTGFPATREIGAFCLSSRREDVSLLVGRIENSSMEETQGALLSFLQGSDGIWAGNDVPCVTA